jgi:D-alanyl-D-alanine carboxypeptidase
MSRRPIPAAFAALTVLTLLGVLTAWMNDAAAQAPQEPRESREPRRRVVRGGPDEGPPLAPPPITASMTKDELSRALDGYLAPLAAKDEFAGVVLIAKDGQPVYQGAYGLADRERKTPIVATTRFNYASIGKAFTRTAIAQLIGQNKLALTDTVGKLLPDYPNEQTRAATVEQLLTMRGGIADFFGPAFDAAPKTQFASNADYFRLVSNQPPLFAPGAREQYCNGCYIVLGAIIERVSGMPYEQYIAEHVFKRAGMSGAGFIAADPRGAARGYTRRGRAGAGSPGGPGGPDGPGGAGGPGGADARPPLRDNADMHGVAGSAAGGSYGQASDLLAFDNALREQRLLDAKMTGWYFNMPPPPPGRVTGLNGGIAGGAPGINSLLESAGPWTVIVISNLDPPSATRLGAAIAKALTE